MDIKFSDGRYHNSRILIKQIVALITIRRRLISWVDCKIYFGSSDYFRGGSTLRQEGRQAVDIERPCALTNLTFAGIGARGERGYGGRQVGRRLTAASAHARGRI